MMPRSVPTSAAAIVMPTEVPLACTDAPFSVATYPAAVVW